MKRIKNNQISKKFTNLSNNSKKIKKNGAFFIINGETQNGNLYIQDAIKNGATNLISENKEDFKKIDKKINTYLVSDTRKAFANSCTKYFLNPSDKLDVCGITGTNGKTSVSFLLKKIWRKESPGLIGTIETSYSKTKSLSSLTTPDTYELNETMSKMVKKNIKNVFLEVSSHSLAMSRIECININSAIFTNMSRDHLDFHKNFNEYFNCKSKLFMNHLRFSKSKNKIAVINMDDKYGLKLLKLISKDIKVITYSLRNKNADFYLKNNYKLNSKFLLEIENKRKTYFIKTSLFGEYNFQNILAAFSYSLTKGLNVEKIIKGIEAFRGAPGRLEKIKNNNLNIFIDYAHTPDALKKSLISLKENFNNKKLFVVFGCGGNRDKGKRKTMGAIAEEFADKVILTSDNPRFEDPLKIIEDILGGFKKKGEKAIIINRREAIRSSIKNLNYNCVLLIAGKGHENYQEIDGKRKTFSDLEEAKEALKEYAS
mgnify:FL=1